MTSFKPALLSGPERLVLYIYNYINMNSIWFQPFLGSQLVCFTGSFSDWGIILLGDLLNTIPLIVCDNL